MMTREEAPGALVPPDGRGCGSRTKGGAYLESGLVDDGVSIDELLIDPPRPLDGLVVPKRGVLPLEIGGITHVLDVVGEDSYPFPTDYIEECRRYGASRRVPKTFDFSVLSEGSCILFIHRHALVHNPGDLHPYRCPKGLHDHAAGEVCIGACWQAITGEHVGTPDDPLLVQRDRPSLSYQGRRVPEGTEAKTEIAFFLRLPITRIAVVVGGASAEVLERARTAGLPAVEVEE